MKLAYALVTVLGLAMCVVVESALASESKIVCSDGAQFDDATRVENAKVVADIVVSPASGSLRKIEFDLPFLLHSKNTLCLSFDRPVDVTKVHFYPDKTSPNTTWIADVGEQYRGEVKLAVYSRDTNENFFTKIAIGAYAQKTEKLNATIQCLQGDPGPEVTQAVFSRAPRFEIELQSGGPQFVEISAPKNINPVNLNLCIASNDSDAIKFVHLIEGSGRWNGEKYQAAIDVHSGFSGQVTAFLLETQDDANASSAGSEHIVPINVLSITLLHIREWLGLEQQQVICNRNVSSGEAERLFQPRRVQRVEAITLRPGGVRAIKIPEKEATSGVLTVICLASNSPNFKRDVEFVPNREKVTDGFYVSYVDIRREFTGQIRAFVLKQNNLSVATEGESEYFYIGRGSEERHFFKVADISVKPEWEYFIRQDGREVTQSLLPYQQVYLWYPEREVSIKLSGAGDGEERKMREGAVAEERFENDVLYKVYNLGDFDPGTELNLSLEGVKGDSSKWYVPRRRLFVRPADYSLRFGKGLVQNAERAPEFVSLYVRLRRSEILNSSTGLTAGVSVDQSNKVYFGGLNVEMYDSISVTIAGAYVEDPDTKAFSDMKAFFGLSADLRIVTDFLSGMSKMYSGKD